MRGDLRRPHTRGHRRCREERRLERSCPDEQVATENQLRAHHRRQRAQRHLPPADRGDEQRAGDGLRGDVGDRRSLEPEVRGIDQEWRRHSGQRIGQQHDADGAARVLHSPSQPLPARTSSTPGTPQIAMRSQFSASWAIGPEPPASARVSGPAAISPTTTQNSPIATASQLACTPSLTAASTRPAPKKRAARLVVPYSRNVPTSVMSDMIAAPMPSAASGVVPRWPTTAVSTSRYSGSAARTANADPAQQEQARRGNVLRAGVTRRRLRQRGEPCTGRPRRRRPHPRVPARPRRRRAGPP